MTTITSNNTTISAQEQAPPLKVALAGLTMIQQSLVEFYFETREGKKQYIQVLGKDADAYITNFDESGSTEAWTNLYAHDKKPTLVLSDYHKTADNYIYIPKPITPIALENAAILLNKLLTNTRVTPSSDFLQFSATPQHSNTIETPLPLHEESIPATTTIKHIGIKQELDEFLPFEEQKISPQKQVSFSELERFDAVNLQEEKTEVSIPSFEKTIKIEDTKATSPIIEKIPENIEFKKVSIPTIDYFEKEESKSHISPDDDLEALLNELTIEDAKQKEQNVAEEKASKHNKNTLPQKTKEENRWEILCGEYDDISYTINTDKETYFKPTNTLLPYLKDTINFSKRSNCWMEISYKYLSIIIDPESKCIYSNTSLNDKNFIYLCLKDIDEDQIELEEIDTQGITRFKQKNINKKYFNYHFEAFLWTTSLIISHGRLPDDITPDKKISINNWLNLKEVEKFPHIMQIAAVFNQHTASLNEVATWMNLPKRYVYSFYNGVEALDMIEKDTEKSKKENLISLMQEEKESMLKKILFTKIL